MEDLQPAREELERLLFLVSIHDRFSWAGGDGVQFGVWMSAHVDGLLADVVNFKCRSMESKEMTGLFVNAYVYISTSQLQIIISIWDHVGPAIVGYHQLAHHPLLYL